MFPDTGMYYGCPSWKHAYSLPGLGDNSEMSSDFSTSVHVWPNDPYSSFWSTLSINLASISLYIHPISSVSPDNSDEQGLYTIPVISLVYCQEPGMKTVSKIK